MSDLKTVTKSNTVLLIKVAPGGKSELTQAGTCTTEMSNNRATRASVPKQRCGTRWQYQARKSKKLHHKDAMKLTETVYVMMMRTTSGPCNEKLMGLLRAVSLPLGKASRGTKSSSLGMVRPGQQAMAR